MHAILLLHLFIFHVDIVVSCVGHWDFVSNNVYGVCKWSDIFWPDGRVRVYITLSHHHYAELFEGIELIKCLLGVCCRFCV